MDGLQRDFRAGLPKMGGRWDRSRFVHLLMLASSSGFSCS